MKSDYTVAHVYSSNVLYPTRHTTGRFQFLPLILTLASPLFPLSLSLYISFSFRWVGIPEKKGCFFARAAASTEIPRRFSSVVLSRIVISRRGICVLSRLMREKRICQEFNQLGRTLIAEWQLSCSRPSGSLVVKHGGVFDTVLLTGNTTVDAGGTDTSKSHF